MGVLREPPEDGSEGEDGQEVHHADDEHDGLGALGELDFEAAALARGQHQGGGKQAD